MSSAPSGSSWISCGWICARSFPVQHAAGCDKKQVFLSPGLVVGKLRLWNRLGFAFGGGVQIAATQFHAYEHNWVTSVRFPF